MLMDAEGLEESEGLEVEVEGCLVDLCSLEHFKEQVELIGLQFAQLYFDGTELQTLQCLEAALGIVSDLYLSEALTELTTRYFSSTWKLIWNEQESG